jgi:hypothetical protein
MPSYTHAETLAALCVYEYWLACESRACNEEGACDEDVPGIDQWNNLVAYRENQGSFELRDRAIEMAIRIEDAFSRASTAIGNDWNDGHAFDFELVPLACDMITWTQDACLMPMPDQIVEMWAAHAARWQRADWMRMARARAAAHYADDGTVFEQDWLDRYYDGLTPAEKAAPVTATEAVYAYAEKYGLTRTSKGY